MFKTLKLGRAAVAAAAAIARLAGWLGTKGLPAIEVGIAVVRKMLDLQLSSTNGAAKLLELVLWFRTNYPGVAGNTQVDEMLEYVATRLVNLFKAIELFRGAK